MSLKRLLFLTLLFPASLAQSPPKKGPSIGLTVVNRSANKAFDSALAAIFSNFQAIASSQPKSSLAAVVSTFESTIQTLEFNLVNHQSNVASLVAAMQEKIQAVRSGDSGGILKDFLDGAVKTSSDIATVADFSNGTTQASSGDATDRLTAISRKVASYLQVQMVAARNVTTINRLLTTFGSLIMQNSQLMMDRDFRNAFNALRGAFIAIRDELYQYAADCGSVANNILNLQYDLQLKTDGCSTRPKCGTFKLYNPGKDAKAPKREAFLAGTYWNRAEVFVGTGSTNDDRYTPGRLMVESPGPAVFMEAYFEVKDNSPETMRYLLDHPNLRWVNHTHIRGGQWPANAIFVNNPDMSFGIGRYVKDGVTQIGKVMGYSGLYYGDNGTSFSAENFQILVC